MTSPASRRRRALCTLAAVLVAAPWTGALATTFPDKPVTLLVAFAPGGNVDVTARALGPALAKALGQPVVIDNRAGGGGTIGSTAVARARPDGYTLMLGSTATNATAPALLKTASYDPVRSFTVIGAVSTTPSVVVVAPKTSARSYRELVEQSKAKSQGFSMGSPGTGSLNHLTTELLKQKTGLNATHIPYKGAGPALTDLLGNQLDAMVDQLSSSAPFLKDGRLRAVAQTGAQRSPLLPDVPTLREQGIAGVDVAVYTGVFAPAGLPPEVEQTLVKALATALQDPEVQQRLAQQGSERLDLDRPAFARYVAEEAKRWAEVIRAAGITQD
ncbi:tripartite tricarboxylate transporter substrate binding protein [Piscinibacter sakaiensis]|uniref:Putative exported protein n=1 Tax=Piscinibacter sakaiensis TaxID=1547922 RepID=A0A0K8NVX5_PISS1|nr:tripartite tricarboxylate transporter substrate binding protein [Piscinibacter sakaiensis]GAP34434.1 putative exported protein [Piscinibacter sakaiensis]